MATVRRAAGPAGAVVVALALLSACGILPSSGSSTTSNTDNSRHAIAATVINYRETHPEWLSQQHKTGHINYPMSPPAGGPHNPYWQDCVGEVYTAQIANEHAVHSLEHGAVWVTYRPDLPPDQIAVLADQVKGRPFMFMSPYPGLDRPISLQAWGYQVKVDSADDPAIVAFIARYRVKASMEPTAPCSGGVTDTGTEVLLNG